MLKEIWADNFNKGLIILLAILAIILFIRPDSERLTGDGETIVEFFFLETCPHCHEQMKFNNKLVREYDIKIIYRDVANPANQNLMQRYAEQHNISRPGTPFTVIGDQVNVGYDTDETTGEKLRAMLENETIQAKADINTIDVPFFGSINVLDYSLPVLSILLGFIDGFNPCAMWMLVYLISLVITLKSKKRMWLIVGTFVAAEGILYYLFMTAWLNAFLFIGFVKPVTILVGLFAVGFGIINVREFIKTRNEPLMCKVGDVKSKKKTMHRMEKIVHSPLTWATFGGIVVLAFIVNALEFVCSAGIPAIFTQVLAISDITTFQHYFYLFLYDIFYMLDDFIVFGLALFAMNTSLGDKYAKYCKLIGGAILLILGFILAFMPQLLQ